MVGNPDAYALQQPDGTYRPVRARLDETVLKEHLAQRITVGTYIGHSLERQQVTVARTLCFDVDDGDTAESLTKAWDIAAALNELFEMAVHPGIEFSGRRGYHVWVVLQDYRPNDELRRIGRATLALARTTCEVYPKQDEVRDLGNLVKLPGSIHLQGRANNWVPDGRPRPVPMPAWERVLAALPPEQHARRGSTDSRFPCMTAIQDEGVEEGGRNIQLFHLAAMLRRAGVTDENVEVIIRSTNEKGDPLDEFELSTLLESSKNSGPICSQLPEARQCGDLCIHARIQGLHARPRQLRFAGEGEPVVVTVAKRDKNGIYLEHPDAQRMKAVLNGN
jgi:hypothetical protein